MELLSIICIAGFTPTMVFNYFLDDPAVLPKSDNVQKQPTRGVPRKRRSENMQQIYRRAPMPKCDFNKVEKQLYWNHTSAWDSPVNLLHIFRASFLKNTSERLLLNVAAQGMIKPVVVPRKFYIRSNKNKVKSMKEGAQLLFNCFSEVIKRIAAHGAFLIIDKILSLLFYLYI